jgi:hypothetical protein
VLDFFSGSGTTADAVMQLNTDNPDQIYRYILVQIEEKTDLDSDTFKAGYKTICELGIDRIKKAANIISSPKIDKGFKLFYTMPIPQNTLSKMESFSSTLFSSDEIVSEIQAEAVLTTWMLQDGHQLTANCEIIDLTGYKSYKIDSTLYLIDAHFSIEKNFKKLIELIESGKSFSINKIVLLGYSFDTQTLLSLKENTKHLINGRSSADIHLEVRY